MGQRRPRSTRSYTVELAATVVAIALVWLFLINGGPTLFGQLWASLVGGQ
jgi:hypothetical protein